MVGRDVGEGQARQAAAGSLRRCRSIDGGLVAKRAVAVLGLGSVEPDTEVLTSDDLGLTRGDGCFEATRVVFDESAGYRIDHLDLHLERLARSSAALCLPTVAETAWRTTIRDLVGEWDYTGEAILKLMITRGRESAPTGPTTALATLTPTSPTTLQQRRTGVAVLTLNRGTAADAFTGAPWLLGGVKTLSYAMNVAAQRYAAGQGADDVIFVSSDGYVLEGPTSAVIWLTGDTLVTTRTGGTGILESITQQATFSEAARDGVSTAHRLATIAEIESADGLWLASSGRGIARVHTLNGQALTTSPGWTERLSAFAGF
jgi:4-amino-4-deoxychorismate lyase